MASGDELAPFVLANVEGLHDSSQEREKGSGAYGVVYKVSVNGMPCIAKRLHAILTTGVAQREQATVQTKFRNECIILSKLRHPNIVHFVGVCYGKNPKELSLIMECLHTDLDQCLETQPNIPLPDKLSILLDVSYGLLYLHTSNPPIIHRDLTAPNILLTKGLRAKIADLGVSKLLSTRSLSAHTQTKGPGQILYMPPEALKEHPKYDSKLDVFSFGHLAIFVSSQEFPKVYEVTITHAVLEQGNLQILKRQKSLDAVGQDHCLYPLIRQCLMDDPERRPSTDELNKAVMEASCKYRQDPSKVAAGVEGVAKENDKLRKENQNLVGEMEALRVNLKMFEEDFKSEREDRQNAHAKMAEIETQYDKTVNPLRRELESTLCDLQKHKTSLQDTEHLLFSQRKELETEIATLKKAKRQGEQEVMAKTQQVKQYKMMTDKYHDELHALKEQASAHKEQILILATKLSEDSRVELKNVPKGKKKKPVGQEVVHVMAEELQAEVKKRQKAEAKVKELTSEVEKLKKPTNSYDEDVPLNRSESANRGYHQHRVSDPAREHLRQHTQFPAVGHPRPSAHEPAREHPRQLAREPAREHPRPSAHEPAREHPRQLAREPAREHPRPSAHEPAREHPRQLAREPAREHPRPSAHEPAREHPRPSAHEPAREHPRASAHEPAREHQIQQRYQLPEQEPAITTQQQQRYPQEEPARIQYHQHEQRASIHPSMQSPPLPTPAQSQHRSHVYESLSDGRAIDSQMVHEQIQHSRGSSDISPRQPLESVLSSHKKPPPKSELDFSFVRMNQKPHVCHEEAPRHQYQNVEDESNEKLPQVFPVKPEDKHHGYVNVEDYQHRPYVNLPSTHYYPSSSSPSSLPPSPPSRDDFIERDSPPSSFLPPASNADYQPPVIHGQQFLGQIQQQQQQQRQQQQRPHIGGQHYQPGGDMQHSEDVPLDPNLICPHCGLKFRLGEIQAFRMHAASCS